MGQGALGSVAGGLSTGNPLGLALGIVLMPVFAVGGGIYGAAAAHPKEETEAAIKAIERLYDDKRFLGAVDGLVKKQLGGLGYPEASGCGPTETGRVVHDRANFSGAASEECVPEDPRNTLTLNVIYSFLTAGTYSPDLLFSIRLSATAANANRAQTAQDFRWVYVSPKLDFFAATAANAADLRRRIKDTQEKLADAIVQDLFVARRLIKVAGQYFPEREGINFMLSAITPGTVRRIPTESQMTGVPERALQERPDQDRKSTDVTPSDPSLTRNQSPDQLPTTAAMKQPLEKKSVRKTREETEHYWRGRIEAVKQDGPYEDCEMAVFQPGIDPAAVSDCEDRGEKIKGFKEKMRRELES